jgi:hypothetical protein
MKNVFFIALSMTMLYIPCMTRAQTEAGMSDLRIQVRDGLPLAFINAFTIGLTDAFSNSFSDWDIKREGESSVSGLWSIGYRYYVAPRFNIGADIGYMKFNADYLLTKGAEERKGERNTTFLLALPNAEYVYLNKPKVQLYGNLGLGMIHLSGHSDVAGDGQPYDYSASTFAFQVNPIGVRFGQRFGGFAELGFGLKGIFSAGFSARF